MAVGLASGIGHALTYHSGPRTQRVCTAECECGWDSGRRPTSREAYDDWLEHVVAQVPEEVKVAIRRG